MEIVEEVKRRRQTVIVEDVDSTYSELKDLIEGRMSFDHVHEEKYYRDVEAGKTRAKLRTEEHLDQFTEEELEIHIVVDSDEEEMNIQIRAKLLTHYPEKYRYHTTVWYYAYRSLYDKFLYGSVREGYEPAVEEKLETLMENVRESLEA